MKKVGILSMQRIKNYGSFLQAYGLKKVLENLDCEVEFVDYHIEEPVIKEETSKKNDKISKAIKALKGEAPLKQKIQYIIHKKNYGKKYYDLLGLTKEPNYNPKLDMLVIGSDEVFNCIQKNKNVGYSLELFGKNNNANKVITYAASFGNTTIDKLKKYEKDKEVGSLLNKIDAISVRDNNSGEVVEQLTDKKVHYNLDPVLIYDYSNQEELIPEIKIKEKYMIVYAYNDRIKKSESEWIREFAKKKNLKVYAIGGAQSCADKFIDCSPFEVLAYFKGAEYIITDTFHGSIFSVIMKKQFATLVRKSVGNEYGNEEKLTDLLERLGLAGRKTFEIDSVEEILNLKVDYDKVESIIKTERKHAIEYLSKQVNLIKNEETFDKSICCGCGACVNICPKNAITMQEDEYGFKYPSIDEEKCIKCGLCKKVCNYTKSRDKNTKVNNDIEAYAAVSRSDEVLKSSASGGVFAAIAENVINDGGIVYGCSMNMNENVEIKHIRITNTKDLKKLQGSKYVQSDIGNIYKEVKKDLENDKTVLFSGTPCQVDGLYGFLLGKKYENLFTIDIICHGVPSQKMFKDYIYFLENKDNIKITDFSFRDKTKGWGLYAKYKICKNNLNVNKIIPSYKSSYYQLFLDSVIYRDNCYQCPYAGSKRIGDITIGDYWGIEEEHKEELRQGNIKVSKGISCILINNTQGNSLIQKYGENISLIKSKFPKVANHNKQLNISSKMPKVRNDILRIYKEKGYSEIDNWYFKHNKYKILLKNIWWKIPTCIKNKITKR